MNPLELENETLKWVFKELAAVLKDKHPDLRNEIWQHIRLGRPEDDPNVDPELLASVIPDPFPCTQA